MENVDGNFNCDLNKLAGVRILFFPILISRFLANENCLIKKRKNKAFV